jgi:hypothetical protein
VPDSTFCATEYSPPHRRRSRPQLPPEAVHTKERRTHYSLVSGGRQAGIGLPPGDAVHRQSWRGNQGVRLPGHCSRTVRRPAKGHPWSLFRVGTPLSGANGGHCSSVSGGGKQGQGHCSRTTENPSKGYRWSLPWVGYLSRRWWRSLSVNIGRVADRVRRGEAGLRRVCCYSTVKDPAHKGAQNTVAEPGWDCHPSCDEACAQAPFTLCPSGG